MRGGWGFLGKERNDSDRSAKAGVGVEKIGGGERVKAKWF